MKKSLLVIGLAILQVFILISLPGANSYLISAAEFWNDTDTYGTTHEADASYSVAGANWKCCKENVEGAICQNVLSENDCAVDTLPTRCEEVSECRVGCCVDPVEGLCTSQSTKLKCEEDGGDWKNGAACNIEECQKGCCVLGQKVEFVSDDRCNFLSLGTIKDFRDLKTEFECIALQESLDYGACVTNGTCIFGTENHCIEIGGEFREDKLCSNPSIGVGCEEQDHTGCAEGKDEIYWFDSCGNRENIYSSDEDASWNDGKVLDKEDGCGANSANIGSNDCGNCNYLLGSKCEEVLSGKKIEDGNFVCSDINCIDEKGIERKNGESWCMYDAFIGEGKDTVGSRHWRRGCIDGEIKTEPCPDYRGGICVQGEIEKEGTNEKFTAAACVANEAMICTGYNGNSKTVKENCEKNSACILKEIDIAEGFKFDMCVGKYPRGFDLIGGNYESNQKICDTATQTCTVLYEKKITGWECVYNCDCEKKKFGQQMNDLCISLGDCGSYVNYVGEAKNSSRVRNSKKVAAENYKEYAIAKEGQFAEPKSLAELVAPQEGDASGPEPFLPEENMVAQGLAMMGVVTGAGGMLVGGLGWAFGASYDISGQIVIDITGRLPVTAIAPEGSVLSTEGALAGKGFLPTYMGPVMTFLNVVGIGMAVGGVVSMVFGLQGDAALATTIGGLGGAIGGYLGVTGFFGTTFGTFGGAIGGGAASLSAGAGAGAQLLASPLFAAFVWAAIVAIVVAIIVKVAGIGETKEVRVEFKCMPWKPKFGSDDCHICNEDPLRPCTEYRCESLGSACEILNEEEEYPVCVSRQKNDLQAPQIEVKNVSEGYQFIVDSPKKVRILTNESECIPEFTPVGFLLETDKYAECRFDFLQKENFEGMEEYFMEGNAFVFNHTGAFMMPSLQSLQVYNLTGNIQEMFGEMNMYIRCSDKFGNYNKNEFILNSCISQGEDLTAPIITKYKPSNGSYLPYVKDYANFTLYASEPAECKYAYFDVAYENMPNTMNCETEVLGYGNYGWPCSVNLTGLIKDENKIYIKCKDQPWETNSSLRNVNEESFEYDIRKSNKGLSITSVSPDGDIESGFEPVSVQLRAETYGGAENNKAVCYYKFSENGFESQFQTSFARVHRQDLTMMMRGNYKIYVRCEDVAGNEDFSTTEFSVEVDNSPPIVLRAFQESGKLKVITDEPAECAYSLTNCKFDLENGTSITTGISNNHYINADLLINYYVRCEDSWGNKNSECAIVLNPGFETNE